MDARRERNRPEGDRPAALSRSMWLIGTLAAVFYGGAISGLSGAIVGLLFWLLVGGVISQVRTRPPRHPDARQGDTPPEETPQEHAAGGETAAGQSEDRTEQELFDQLTRTPCPSCGTPSLLDLCLECAESLSRRRQRRTEGTPSDEPDDPPA